MAHSVYRRFESSRQQQGLTSTGVPSCAAPLPAPRVRRRTDMLSEAEERARGLAGYTTSGYSALHDENGAFVEIGPASRLEVDMHGSSGTDSDAPTSNSDSDAGPRRRPSDRPEWSSVLEESLRRHREEFPFYWRLASGGKGKKLPHLPSKNTSSIHTSSASSSG